MSVSVIICCYNSSSRLAPTLECLANQISVTDLEVILVDNMSTDGTAGYAEKCWRELGSKFQLNLVVEKQLGLSYARLAGAKAARGEYLVFCDDDNSLFPDYCLRVIQLFRSNPKAAILGGCGIPVFEKMPETWLSDPSVISKFAVGPQASTDGPIDKGRLWVYGAGMAIRKELFFKLHELPTFLSDRSGIALLGGGDVELCLKATWLGYKIFYSSNLKFNHFIPESRSSFRYLWRMAYPNVLSGLIIKAYKLLINDNLKYYERSPSKRLLQDLASMFCKNFLVKHLFLRIPWQKKVLTLYGYFLTGYTLIFKAKEIDQTYRDVWKGMLNNKDLLTSKIS